jgi:enamine deaminase RidA (YjgF/YER057c/UK114 family)
MERIRHSNRTEFEHSYGYCRAVRVGAQVFVSGTTAHDVDLDGDTGTQLTSALSRIGAALQDLDASMADVVRTVVYVRDMADIEAVAKIHSATFGAHPPASTIVEVSRLSPVNARIEIEVTAITALP